MGLGGEIPLFLALGFVLLGPKRMQLILSQIARAKIQWNKSGREIQARLASELDATPEGEGTRH